MLLASTRCVSVGRLVTAFLVVLWCASARAFDTDGDGIIDALDNCSELSNPDQLDPGLDGFGVACDPDYNDDGAVGGPDWGLLLQHWGETTSDPGFDPDFDHNADGGIGGPDFGVFIQFFGDPPGPSGLACAGLVPCDVSIVDVDGDGFPNDEDNCLDLPQADQTDSNGDGFGNACDPDLDDNGVVNDADQAEYLCVIGTIDPDADFNGDGIVGGPDFGVLVAHFGGAPGPTGLAETFIDPSFDPTADTDGDGFRDFEDNCVGLANATQKDHDLDGFGVACDPDYDNDGDVDETDSDYFLSVFGLAVGDPSFDANADHNEDGVIGAPDHAVLVNLFGSAPGPTGLPCPPDTGSNQKPSVPQGFIRVRRDGEYRSRISATDPNGDPLTFELWIAPSAGTIGALDANTGEYLYVPDPLSSVLEDSFTVRVSDGTLANLASVRIEFWQPEPATFTAGYLNDHTVVAYNANATEALAIAQHYVTARGIDPSRLCPLELPNGLYAHKDEMLAARKQIVEACICPAIPAGVRPSPCEIGNLTAVAAASPITHLVLAKGIPARMYGTGWPSDAREPSLDYYLSYLAYRDEDLFASGSEGRVESGYEGNLIRPVYRRAVLPGLHGWLAHGRIEAMTVGRTTDLIDRTLSAEAAGFTGNVFTESVGNFDLLRGRVGSNDPSCGDSVLTGSIWPHASCRAGTTQTLAAGFQSGGLPGESNTTIPVAIDTGLFLGINPWPNGQRGFDGIQTLRSWHRSEENCAELCSETADPAGCAQNSTDFFEELNTDCVGAAPGMVGMQLRSYPVAFYGFFPPGWRNGDTGHGGLTPPSLVGTGGFTDARFTDATYLHFGAHASGIDDASTCTDFNGQVMPCPEVIGVTLGADVTPIAALPVSGTREFVVKLRYRNQASAGARLRVLVRLKDTAQAIYWLGGSQGHVDISAGATTWMTREVSFTADETRGADVAEVRVQISADVQDGVRGWLDLDGIELIDLQSGDSLLPVALGSFTEPIRDTNLGDYAANAIDRLGAVAWWGSSSHHVTGGGAFPQQAVMARAFLAGRTLGEAVTASEDGMSGIFYGDPLYRPSAAALFFPSDTASKVVLSTLGGVEVGGLVVDADNLETFRLLYMNVLHGTANLASVNWSLSTCGGFDEAACDAQGLWSVQQTGQGVVHEAPVDWSANLIDPNVNQEVTIRLRVWNAGEEDRALYDFVHLDYQAAPGP